MELRFYGATGDTTGSCHMLSANGAHVLLDCGLYQGRREEAYRRNREFAFAAGRVDAVVQSHAHVDHSGKLPMLVRDRDAPVRRSPRSSDDRRSWLDAACT